MPAADYSSYHQASGTGADGTKFSNFIDAVQATVNSLDTNNLAAAAGITAGQIASGVVGMTRICDFTAVGALASFDTNTLLGGNIPSTYKHLKIVCMGRGDLAATSVGVVVRINNDSGANYASQQERGNAATASASEVVSSATPIIAGLAAASATAGHAGGFEAVIPSYAGTTFFKNVISYAGFNMALTTGNIFAETHNVVWANAAAITRISILPTSGNFIAGSQFTLYGLS